MNIQYKVFFKAFNELAQHTMYFIAQISTLIVCKHSNFKCSVHSNQKALTVDVSNTSRKMETWQGASHLTRVEGHKPVNIPSFTIFT